MRHNGMMSKLFAQNICRVVGILLVVAATTAAADARSASSRHYSRAPDDSAFDGPWSVLIQAESGPCSGSYRYGVDIVDGAVTFEGTPYGRVAPNGRVRVRLSLGDQNAEGVGRLSRGAGAGVWRGVGESGMCTGRWFAERRSGTTGAGR